MKKGFTLIELLVVVLIIGILSAVALPQYTKAVEKSRVSEAKILLKALNNAEEIYALANGSQTYDLSELDISFPGTFRTSGGRGVENDVIVTKNFELQVDECNVCKEGGGGFCCDMYADRKDKGYSVRMVSNSYDGGGEAGVFYCLTPDGSESEVCPQAGAIKKGEDWIFQ